MGDVPTHTAVTDETQTTPEKKPLTPEQKEELKIKNREAKRRQRARDKFAAGLGDASTLEAKKRIHAQVAWRTNLELLNTQQRQELSDHINYMNAIDMMMNEVTHHILDRKPISVEDAVYFWTVLTEAQELARKFPPTEDKTYMGWQHHGTDDIDYSDLDIDKQPFYFKNYGIPVDHINPTFECFAKLVRNNVKPPDVQRQLKEKSNAENT